jgi:hypothetical protein
MVYQSICRNVDRLYENILIHVHSRILTFNLPLNAIVPKYS